METPTIEPAAGPAPAATRVAHLDDLPVGSMRLVRVAGRRLCLVRTSTGVHAIDNACPHEGYGMTQGTVSGDVITCAWHNWKFRLSDGACLLGEEDIRSHRVSIEDDGSIVVVLVQPDPAVERPRLLASLRRGIEDQRTGRMSREVVRLLRASANPGELVWEAVAFGAPRGEFGIGHSIAAAADCLAMVDLYDGDQRALPVVQALAGVAESERGRRRHPLPPPASALPPDPAQAFRTLVEDEATAEAQALVLGGLEAGLGPQDLRRWFALAASDHHLDYGHGAIYTQKAFELLDRLGWERAGTVLPYLVPALVYGTREDLLPYMRPFLRELATADLHALADGEPARGWRDDGSLLSALLGPDRAAPATAALAALRSGASVDDLLDVAVEAVSRRLLRYDIANEFDFGDDFGWLDITHGITYANAARWLHHHEQSPDTLRLALFCLFLAHWTGRHEWHTAALADPEPEAATGDLLQACLDRRPDDAAAIALSTPVTAAGVALQQASLLDRTSTFIIHAHGVKTARAAAEEARRSGSPLVLAATARFLAGPKLERFVAATVTRSIDFVAGRTVRD